MNTALNTRAFSPAIIVGLMLVSIFSFSAFVVLSAFEPELTSGRDGRAHALSTSAVGFAAIVRIVRDLGIDVSIGRRPGDGARRNGLVVLTPERPLSWSDVNLASGEITLIVMPKWAVFPDPRHRGWVSRVQAYPPALIGQALTELAPNAKLEQATDTARRLLGGDGFKTTTGAIENLQTISGPGLTPVIVDEANRALVVRLSHDGALTNVYLLADPDLLNTQGMAQIENARAGVDILNYLRQNAPIIFDVTLNGLGAARSALRLAFQPPFLGATLGFAIAAALLGWRAVQRFGPSLQVRRAIAHGKAALADNSAALLRLTRREHKLGPGYARLTSSVIAEKVGVGRKEEAETAEMLDRMSTAQAASATFTQLAEEAAAAKTSQHMLDAARKLHAWKEEIARATR